MNLDGIDPAILARPDVVKKLAEIEANAADGTRILVRPSGTQSLIRVMVEADDGAVLDAIMQEIILLIETESQKSV